MFEHDWNLNVSKAANRSSCILLEFTSSNSASNNRTFINICLILFLESHTVWFLTMTEGGAGEEEEEEEGVME